MNEPETTNSWLINEAYKLKIKMNGVLSKDELTNLSNGNYILNLADHDDEGSHWVALNVNPTTIFYFDSFGIPPPMIIRQLSRGRQIIHNNEQIQNYNSGFCGQYCLLFLYFMSKGGSYKTSYEKYLKNFNNEVDDNKTILLKLFRRIKHI